MLRASATSFPAEGYPGLVLAGPNGNAGVVTGAGVLWLEEVQLAGKRALPIGSFLAGARDFIGSRMGARDSHIPPQIPS